MTLLALNLTQLLVLWAQTSVHSILPTGPQQAFVYERLRADVFVWAGAGLAILLVRALSIGIRRSSAFKERVLIVGTSPLVDTIIDELEQQAEHRFTIIG